MSYARYDVGVYDADLYDAAPGTPLVELLVNGAWTDITTYVRVADGIRIRRGRSDWSQAPGFATCDMVLDNRDGRFSPRNSSGAYYPYLTRNTQVRVSVYMDDGSTTIRFWGDISEWPVQWTFSGADVWVTVTACGLRRQLSQGQVPLDSPYKRAASRLTDLAAYWPLEDGSLATVFGSAYAGGQDAKPSSSGVTFASDGTTFDAASDALPVLSGDGAAVSGRVGRYTPAGSPTATTVRMLLKTNSSTATCGVDIVVQMSTGNYYVLEYIPQSDTATMAMYDAAGTSLGSTGGFGTTGEFKAGCRLSLEFTTNGTGVDMGFATLVPGATVGLAYGPTTVASQSLGYVTNVTVRNGTTPSGGTDVATTVGHISVESTKTSIFDLSGVLTGNAGETALTRVNRLAAEQGVSIALSNGNALGITSAQLGPQAQDTFLNLIDDAMFVDGGISTEAVTSRSLYCRSLGSLYTNTTTIALVLSQAAQRLNALQPVDDDQNIANDVTAQRPEGALARWTITTGNLSTGTVGTYSSTVELNVYQDGQLLPQAQWRATVGTQDYPRWPVVGMDAANNLTSTMRTNLVALREGSVFEISGLPNYAGMTGSFADVIVVGWTETITDSRWQFEFNCNPATPYTDVFILDSASRGLLDSGRLAL